MSRVAEALLRRHRKITITALALLAGLAWTWLAAGAGMAMSEPGMAGHGMAMAWGGPRIALTLAMWWVMMVAMMIPAAAPVILLYAHAARANLATEPHVSAFVSGYLLAWLGFSGAALAMQIGLEASGALSPMAMSLTNRWLAAGVLIAAGAYQLSPAKDSCLAHCRNPAEFIALHFRPGAPGALRMGLVHGAYCVGCCWMLMALLFVGGVMNLAWIALLTLAVAGEKLLPWGKWLARLGGVLFLGWGVIVLLGGSPGSS